MHFSRKQQPKSSFALVCEKEAEAHPTSTSKEVYHVENALTRKTPERSGTLKQIAACFFGDALVEASSYLEVCPCRHSP